MQELLTFLGEWVISSQDLTRAFYRTADKIACFRYFVLDLQASRQIEASFQGIGMF
ncbi:MAG: hypothetical protein WBZ19_02650 [Chthoniobacterales bacterium]